MQIINLVENTDGVCGCVPAHGLSFYIKTNKHNVLMDLGPSEVSLDNAKRLGVDLTKVDIVILSHGHYDHSGGILPFAHINNKAKIYMQKAATKDYYSFDKDKKEYRYIGIDKEIKKMSQVIYLSEDFDIDEELSLFTIKERKFEIPHTNVRLYELVEDRFVPDLFMHEQCLVVRDGNKKVLLSGCAHNGIPNIMEAYIKKYNSIPDLVISGFHLMKKTEYLPNDVKEIENIAYYLNRYDTHYVTCHCTGTFAYQIMKEIMGDKISYVSTGEEISEQSLF